MMTPRENLLSSLRRQGCETVPLDCGGFCASQIEAFKARFGHGDIAGYFNVPFRAVGIALEPAWRDAAALYPREALPAETEIDTFGVGHSRQPNCYHMTRMHHPLRGEEVSAAEVAAYPLPRLAADAEARLRRDVVTLQQKGLAASLGMHCTVWETAWYIRGIPQLMMDMVGEEDKATFMLDTITEHACHRRLS